MIRPSSLSLLVLILSLAPPIHARDWPQWQGVHRDGVADEQNLLQEWPEGGPPLAWQVTGLGGGDSAPSVANGVLYGMSTRGDEEIVWARAAADGQEIWAKPIGAAVTQMMPQSKEGPGCTPTVDDDRLYVIGMGGAIACLRRDNGEILWQHNLIADFGGVIPMWSYRESPLIDGEKLICTPGGPETTMVALDKMAGETIWTMKPLDAPAADGAGAPAEGKEAAPRRPGRFGPRSGAAYSSAIAIDFEGQRQYVQLTADALIGVDAATGQQLWQYRKPANPMGINCTTPLYHDGKVFASSAYGAGGGAVQLTKNADGSIEATEIFFTNRMQNHHGGVILLDGALYGANGGNGGGNLICIDFATGKVLWDERRGKERVPKGSIAYADGRLYYRTEEGAVLLIEPSREAYLQRGRFEQPGRTAVPAWAHPVIAGGKLYIRDQDTLYCYDIAAK